MRAVQLTAFGNPVDGLECVDIPEPDTPGPNQVLIGVEYSPINANDLMVARGIYAFRPPLPAVIGNEGVGRVLAVGPGVESVRLGDRVLAPLSSFTWRERIVISAAGLSGLPADADPQQLAMLAAARTAHRREMDEVKAKHATEVAAQRRDSTAAWAKWAAEVQKKENDNAVLRRELNTTRDESRARPRPDRRAGAAIGSV